MRLFVFFDFFYLQTFKKKTFRMIVADFNVIRVKNGFAERTVPFGFRQILMNVVYKCPNSKLTMVREFLCVVFRLFFQMFVDIFFHASCTFSDM